MEFIVGVGGMTIVALIAAYLLLRIEKKKAKESASNISNVQ
jgi:hypothetical protein